MKVKDTKSEKLHQWKPLTASYCCSTDDHHAIFGNFSGCRPSKSDFSKNIAAPRLPSFRKLTFSDVSMGSSSARINEDLAQSFGGDLYDFAMSELRSATHNFASSFLLGEGGFGRVHKGYMDENMRAGLKAQPVAVKLLDIEGLQGHLYDFAMSELRSATHNFASSFLLGEGGFGRVHKGYMDENMRAGLKAQPVAVKLLDIEGLQGHREWLAEVVFLGQLRHPNLVKLIGYCCEDQERVLIYEFMPRGSLENHLFKRLSISLPWATRLKIAIGAAKGLAFLHGAENPVIYRDFKTSNVLLDSDFNAKLSDFGLAKMGPEGSNTHVTTRVMGTYGYAAPEYVSTGHLTTKSDIYSFGVVLLELLTGRRAVEKTRAKNEQNLVDWTKPYLTSTRRLRCIMDPRLAGQYSVKGTKEMGLLALQCISLNPKDRPKMPAIIDTLESLQQLKDMAITYGQWQASPKAGRNAVFYVKERRQTGFGCKGVAVAASPRSK